MSSSRGSSQKTWESEVIERIVSSGQSAKRQANHLIQRKRNLARWRADPISYLQERLGIPRSSIVWSENKGYENHKWDGDKDPLATALQALADWKWVAIQSATGTGKTYLVAAVVLWFLECWENALVGTIAPKADQLKLHAWREIGRLYDEFGWGELQTLELRMKPGKQDWSAVGFVAGVKATEVEQSATKAQGWHAEHMLIVVEEAPGVAGAVMDAFINTSISPHNLILAVGNPDSEHDTLGKFASLRRVTNIRISGFDHPNVVTGQDVLIPGAQTRLGLETLLDKYKSEDAPMYRSRARGIAPKQAADSLIRYEECVAAAGRTNADPGPWAFGVDVANSVSGDEAAIAKGPGSECVSVEAFPCPNNLTLAERVHLEAAEKKTKGELIGVDAIGVGAGTVNRLEQLKMPCLAIQSGGAPVETTRGGFRMVEQFENLRAQMWWQAMIDLRWPEESHLVIPNDPELFIDLCTPKWSKNRRGKIQIQSKDEIKKLLGRSTNKGDAFVYWNWVRTGRVTIAATASQDALPAPAKIPQEARQAARQASPYAAQRKRTW
jgi:phage terminase large subunit